MLPVGVTGLNNSATCVRMCIQCPDYGRGIIELTGKKKVGLVRWGDREREWIE